MTSSWFRIGVWHRRPEEATALGLVLTAIAAAKYLR